MTIKGREIPRLHFQSIIWHLSLFLYAAAECEEESSRLSLSSLEIKNALSKCGQKVLEVARLKFDVAPPAQTLSCSEKFLPADQNRNSIYFSRVI
jgi:hypothetical protein